MLKNVNNQVNQADVYHAVTENHVVIRHVVRRAFLDRVLLASIYIIINGFR
jgi:hypothetical protein